MPSTSKAQQGFMGADLARKRAGEQTETGMSEQQLEEFAGTKTKGLPQHAHKKDEHHHGRHKSSEHAPQGRKPNERGG